MKGLCNILKLNNRRFVVKKKIFKIIGISILTCSFYACSGANDIIDSDEAAREAAELIDEGNLQQEADKMMEEINSDY